MYEVMSKKLLVINILDILNKYSDAEHRLKQKDFIDILRKEYGMEVDRKAVRRNLSYLLECGYDKDEESSRKKKIFQRIIAIQNIIKARLDGNIKNEYTYSDFNEIKKQIAFMNINKRGGSSSTDFKELNKYAEKYNEFIKREIEIINPDYIICCGSYWQIIDHVYDYFKSKKEWGNRKKSEPDIDMYYKLNIKGKIVPAFNVFHPSAIKRNQEYEDLINNIFDKL